MISNRKPQKSLRSFAVSIDKLEEVTQLDFLNLLPKKVQKQLESKVDLSSWKLPATKAGKPDKSKASKSEVNTGGNTGSETPTIDAMQPVAIARSLRGRSGAKSEGQACKVCGG